MCGVRLQPCALVKGLVMRPSVCTTFALLAVLAFWLCPVAQAADKAEKMPIPPADARWTLYCRAFGGPNRVAESKISRATMVKLTGDPNWYLVHGENESTLLFGFYRSIEMGATDKDQKKDAERAHADRKRLAGLRDEHGEPLFPTCFFVPVDAPGDEGPAEWNVQNAPKDASWTLLIGVYRDNPTRKKAAVDAVRELRAKGVEAFYLHAPAASMVYVGQWPASAVIYEAPDTSRLSRSDDEDVMVIERPVDPRAPRVYTDPATGRLVRLVAPEMTIQDASLKQMMAKYPNFHTNGEVLGKKYIDPQDQQQKVEPDPSVISKIPRREASILNTSDLPDQPPEIKTIAPLGPKPAPGGHLKSLDDK
jgi:hypothetical protein